MSRSAISGAVSVHTTSISSSRLTPAGIPKRSVVATKSASTSSPAGPWASSTPNSAPTRS
jgi:hypothetical protein